jgi:chitodextrinase
VAWKAATDESGIKHYEIYKNNVLQAKVEQTQYQFTGLNVNQTLSITVIAVDPHDNRSNLSLPLTVSTIDMLAPQPPRNLKASNISESSFKLTWTADSDNSGIQFYEIYVNGRFEDYSRNTSYTFSNLQSGSYSIQIRSVDLNENISELSQQIVVDTLDKSAPSIPLDLFISNTNTNSVTIQWKPSQDNKRVAGYEILMNGSIIAKTDIAYYKITGLTTKSSISLQVRAYDQAGNFSAYSKPIYSENTIRIVGSKLYVNFKEIPLGAHPPRFSRGSILLPNKAFLEALGFTLKWDVKTKTLTATRSGYQLKLTVGRNVMVVNGTQKISIGTEPVILNNVLMIPINQIAKELGYSIVQS